MDHWLIKSEPDVFGIDHLKKAGREPWSGVRNYQARNFMKEMKIGDLALFYHSSTQPPGVAGIAKVVSKTYPDPTQFQKKSEYFDPKSTEEKPRWWLVDFEYVATFTDLVKLEALKADPFFNDMIVCKKGTRLSITPVEAAHFKRVCKLAGCKI